MHRGKITWTHSWRRRPFTIQGERSRKSPTLPTPWSQIPRLRNCEKVNFCCWKHSVCETSLCSLRWPWPPTAEDWGLLSSLGMKGSAEEGRRKRNERVLTAVNCTGRKNYFSGDPICTQYLTKHFHMDDLINCYGLSVCIPPKFSCWNTKPQMSKLYAIHLKLI